MIYVVGTGPQGRVILDILRSNGVVDAAALTSDQLPPVYQAGDQVIVGIGDNHVRQQVVQQLEAAIPNCTFVSAIHRSAVVAPDAAIGAGTVLMAGAVVNPAAQLGAHVIINTNASVDHDCRLADFSSIGPGVALGGRVRLGFGAAVGIGASVVEDCEIGEYTVVGAGAAVVKSLPAYALCLGVPARVARSRKPGERYVK